MHARWRRSLSEPIASPPNVRLPWRASSRSKGSIPSIPEGGVVPGSASSSRSGCSRHTSSGRRRTPDAPVATAIRHPSRAPREGRPRRSPRPARTRPRSAPRPVPPRPSPWSNARELRRTAAPAWPRSPAIRWPTGPVPASTTAACPASGVSSSAPPCSESIRATAAAAVVFAPFESSITDTRKPPKKFRRTAASSASPAARSLPPDEEGGVLLVRRPSRVDHPFHGRPAALRRHPGERESGGRRRRRRRPPRRRCSGRGRCRAERGASSCRARAMVAGGGLRERPRRPRAGAAAGSRRRTSSRTS